jgi:4-amino-4-deoxy-L-arabinose transferase-like glycosyltransferase
MSEDLASPGPAFAARSEAAARPSKGGALVWLITLTLIARLVAATYAPLTDDEAYYRLWSLRPAFGYFDHPPMVAWWVWVGRQLAGDNPLGVRLASVLGTAGATWLTFDLAQTAGLARRVAIRAAIWLNATFLIGLGGLLAVPDIPNTFFWLATLCCAYRAVKGAPQWWLAAGVAAGLACLSKYSALFLAPGLLLWLGASSQGRRQLRTPWPWLGALIAAAIFAPNVAWNAAHGWMTFHKQFGRVVEGGPANGATIKFIGDFVLLLNPLVAIFAGLSLARRDARPLWLLSAPLALYLVVHSLHATVQGQWPAPIYPLLVIGASAAAEDAQPGLMKALRTAAPWVGFAAIAISALFVLLPPLTLPLADPTQRLRGWPAFAIAVERERVARGAAWVGALDYGVTAQLADRPQTIRAPVAEVFERERYTFETAANLADFRRPGLIVAASPGAGRRLERCFAMIEPLAPLVRVAGRSRAAYADFMVAGPKVAIEQRGCPAA